MPFRHLLTALIILALTACTQIDDAYRIYPSQTATTGAPDCNSVHRITAATYDDTVFANGSEAGETTRIKCYLSDYKVPNAEGWRRLKGGNKIHQPDRYTLSFIEMPENKSALLEPRQLGDLLASFTKGKQDVVMVYVHGWRHDAAPGNGNVIRFRTVLGYARSALNARCIETGAYCDARLTGVYLSWRGRSFAESTKANAGFPGVIGAFPTVWGRKAQSETLGQKPTPEGSIVMTTLSGIQDALDLKPGDSRYDKMLVIGHSFGGNMLATALKLRAEEAIKNHTPGTEMEPLLGDLVVLINPASEASNWTDLQTAMRHKALIPDHIHAVSPSDVSSETHKAQIKAWREMFPRSQRPIYVSLTSTKDWNRIERRGRAKREIEHDVATRTLFPISSYLTLKFDPERATTIGHLTPKYRAVPREGEPPFFKVDGKPVGTSHEMILNSGAKRGRERVTTRYEHSGDPNRAWCGSHSGWLRAAYDRKSKSGSPVGWDTSSRRSTALLQNMNGASLQIRHGLTSEGTHSFAQSVAQATNPLWNIRVYDTAVYGHAGFINFPTLCGINLLWLDDATSPKLFEASR